MRRYPHSGMIAFRALIRQRPVLAMLIVALVLFARAVVPTGYMIGSSAQTLLTVEICGGVVGATAQIELPGDGASHDPSDGHGKADSPCAFTALGMASLGGAGLPLLAIALAFILALGFAPSAQAPRTVFHRIRPPLRGPPAAI